MGRWVPLWVKVVVGVSFLLGLLMFGAGPPPAGDPVEAEEVIWVSGTRCNDDPRWDAEANFISSMAALEDYLDCALSPSDARSANYRNSTVDRLESAFGNDTVIVVKYDHTCGEMDIRGVWLEEDTYHVGILETLQVPFEGCLETILHGHHFIIVDGEDELVDKVDVVLSEKQSLWILYAGITSLVCGVASGVVVALLRRILQASLDLELELE